MHAVACGCCLKREGILRSGAPVRRSVTAPCTYFRIYIPSDGNGRDAVSAAIYRCTYSSRGCCDREPAVERRAPLRALHCAGFTTLIGTYRYTSPAFPVILRYCGDLDFGDNCKLGVLHSSPLPRRSSDSGGNYGPPLHGCNCKSRQLSSMNSVEATHVHLL